MRDAIYRRISPFTIKSVYTRRWIIRLQPRCIQEVGKLPLTRLSFVLIWCVNGLDFWDHHKFAGLSMISLFVLFLIFTYVFNLKPVNGGNSALLFSPNQLPYLLNFILSV